MDLKNKNYVGVGDQLQNLGFSNIYERKLHDLATGWLTKNGSVEEVLVNIGGEETVIQKKRAYDFDVEIIISYHTF